MVTACVWPSNPQFVSLGYLRPERYLVWSHVSRVVEMESCFLPNVTQGDTMFWHHFHHVFASGVWVGQPHSMALC